MKRVMWPLLFLLCWGCADGVAPVIENLEVDTATLVAGEPNSIGFSLDFTDPDGDVQQAKVELVSQDDGVTVLSSYDPVEGAIGVQMARFTGEISFTPATAGFFYLRFSLIDEANNESNALSESIEVVEPIEE